MQETINYLQRKINHYHAQGFKSRADKLQGVLVLFKTLERKRMKENENKDSNRISCISS
jgi:hypothetical protein